MAFAYHKLTTKIYNSNLPLNDAIFKKIKDKLCIGEA